MQSDSLIFLTFLYIITAFGCAHLKEDPKIVDTTFKSEILQETRDIQIWLPTNISENEKNDNRYPLIILLDGNTYFQTTIDALLNLNSLIHRDHGSNTPIIVAIDSQDRERDFTFSKIEMVRSNNTGHGKTFLNFINKELMPYLENQYPINAQKILIGHSLGGLFTINALLDETASFSDYVSIDPSIWWDQDMMEDKTTKEFLTLRNVSASIYTANPENHQEGSKLKKHKKLYDLLSKQMSPRSSLNHCHYPMEDHRSIVYPAILNAIKKISFPEHESGCI